MFKRDHNKSCLHYESPKSTKKIPVKKILQTYFPIGGELFYMTHIFY